MMTFSPGMIHSGGSRRRVVSRAALAGATPSNVALPAFIIKNGEHAPGLSGGMYDG